MATKRKRGATWHYVVRRKGLLPAPVYLTFDDEAEGDKYVAHLERLLDKGIVPEEYKSGRWSMATIANAIDAYLERDVPDNDRLLLQVLRERIGSVTLDKITYDWAEGWVDSMKADDLAASTIRHYVGALARCFDWVVKVGKSLLLVNALRLLPRGYATGHRGEDERDARLECEDEVLRILNGGKPRNRERPFELHHQPALKMLFLNALESGMRMREIFTLEKYQVSFAAKTIFLEKTKNGDKRQVPMSTVLIDEYGRYPMPKEGLIYPWWDGKKETQKKITSLLSSQFARIFAAAGQPEFTFHGLRHEATCRFYERTKMTDVKISKILGWKDTKMCLRYANLRGSDLAEELW